MALWIVPPRGIIEPVPAPELYADDIGAIELNGENIRLYMVADQLPIEGEAPSQRIVVAKIVRPLCNVPSTIGALAQCIYRPPTPFKPKIV